MVLLDSGKLLSFDVYISISKTTKPVRSIRAPTIAKVSMKRIEKEEQFVVPDNADSLTISTEILNMSTGTKGIALAVTAQPPAVGGVFTLSREDRYQQAWSHYSNDICFFAKHIPAARRVVFGSRSGDLLTYSEEGVPLSLFSLSKPARCAAAFVTRKGNSGLVVAHGVGELTIFWTPVVDGPDGLFAEITEHLRDHEILDFTDHTPALAILRWCAEGNSLHARIPSRLQWQVPEELFPGFIGTINCWLRERPKEHNTLWRILEEWIPTQRVPANLSTFADEWRSRIVQHLGGMARHRFNQLSANLSSALDDADQPSLDCVDAGIRSFESHDTESCAESLSEAIQFLTAHPEVPVYYDRIARLPLYSSVEGIVNSPENGDRAAILLTDSSLYEISVTECSEREFDPSLHIQLLRLETTGRPTRIGGVCITPQATYCVSDDRVCDIIPVDGGVKRVIPVHQDCPVSIAARGGEVIVGCISGALFRLSKSDTFDEFNVPRNQSPLMSLGLGRFRNPGILDLAVFEEEGGLALFNTKTRQSEQIAECKYRPTQIIICDTNEDGLENVNYFDPYRSKVRCISGRALDKSWESRELVHSGMSSIGLLRNSVPTGKDTTHVVFGTDDGNLYRVGDENTQPSLIATTSSWGHGATFDVKTATSLPRLLCPETLPFPGSDGSPRPVENCSLLRQINI